MRERHMQLPRGQPGERTSGRNQTEFTIAHGLSCTAVVRIVNPELAILGTVKPIEMTLKIADIYCFSTILSP